MYNMNFTIPAFIILVIMTATYLSRKRLPLRLNRVFLGVLITSLLTVVADYLTDVLDAHPQSLGSGMLWLINYLFLALFLTRSFYLFWFPVDLLDAQRLKKAGAPFGWINLTEQIFLLIGSLNGWIFSIHHGVYANGPLYEFINIQFIVWLVVDFFLLMRMERPVGVRKTGIYVYLTILLSGVVLHYLVPQLIVMNLFCLFAIMTVYLLYLNPDQYIDDITLLFNEKGFNKVLAEAPSRKEFSLVGFAIRNFPALRETRDVETIGFALSEIGAWLSHNWPHLASYYVSNGIFIITSTKQFDEQALLDAISSRFLQPWSSANGDYYLSVNEMVMAPCKCIESSELLIGTIREGYRTICQPDHQALVHIDDMLVRQHLRKLSVQKQLSYALSTSQLVMFLQPIINVKTHQVEGAEALCRLPDEKGGYIFPDEFIPIAQKNGHMGLLGSQMFEKACRFISRQDVAQSQLKWINVNVAPEQFRNPHLLEEFMTILRRYHLMPSAIHLEITEETMIDRTLLHDSMNQFREKGFIFSMDDFGSSYSNMIRLQQNHFTNVKIDRDFTWSYFKKKTALLPDIITTCHDMGMTVVTEGVETKEMAEGVKNIHADYIQGYYYSKPIPENQFIDKYIMR